MKTASPMSYCWSQYCSADKDGMAAEAINSKMLIEDCQKKWELLFEI